MAVSGNSTPIFKGVRRTLLNSAGTVTYTVRTESPNEVIFSGRATNRPGETSVAVELFDILAPHVRQNLISSMIYDALETETPGAQLSTFARRFILSYGSTTENIDVRACYAYDWQDEDYTADNDPVTLVIPKGIPLPQSRRYCNNNATVTLRRFSDSVDVYSVVANRPVNVVFPTDGLAVGDRVRVIFPGYVTQVTPAYTIGPEMCSGRQALYYVNRLGGWDVLPLRGICRQTDAFERESADSYRIMSSVFSPDRNTIRTDTAVTWELNTGILSDAESRTFALNVPGAPMAILLIGSSIWPVTIEDTAVQYLSAASNGRRPVNYTLNVKLAQDRVRL